MSKKRYVPYQHSRSVAEAIGEEKVEALYRSLGLERGGPKRKQSRRPKRAGRKTL